jgi:hypothetical protein
MANIILGSDKLDGLETLAKNGYPLGLTFRSTVK